MSLQGDFAAHYEIQYDDLQSDASVEYDFHPRRAADANGLSLETPGSEFLLRVHPTGMPAWKGRFLGGPGKFSGVFSTPSPTIVCVIIGGQGYWIDVEKPDQYETVRCLPIQIVVPVPAHSLVVFFDFVRAAAYGPNGCLWVTQDLSWDGITFDEIDQDCLKGKGWDSPEERHVSFSVNLHTGDSEGGSNPEKYA